jgi:DNA-binding transcriptional LysR family regulator
LKAVQIGTVRQVLVASPAYLARFGVPDAPQDLVLHHLIASTGPRAASQWRFGARREAQIAIQPRLLVNTVDASVAAAEAGVGIANLLSYQAEDALRAGRLIEVLRPDAPEPLPVHLLFEASRSAAAAVRVFIDGMRAHGRVQGWS